MSAASATGWAAHAQSSAEDRRRAAAGPGARPRVAHQRRAGDVVPIRDLSLLSTREREVYTRRMAGMTHGEIALDLDISPKTAWRHFRRAKDRLVTLVPSLGRGVHAPDPEKAPAPLRPVDLKRCAACSLRGHRPGDPERCYPAMRRDVMVSRW